MCLPKGENAMPVLCHVPGSCSMGIHIILEEIGKPYELRPFDFRNNAQYGADFMAINPKSKVPALIRDDGSVLTEWPAIAMWLALTNPDRKLAPEDIEGQIRAQEIMAYITATQHMQGWTRLWRTMTYTENEAEHPKIKARGKEILEKGMSLFDKQLNGRDYLLGDFSIADPALYFLETWLTERVDMQLPANVAAHYGRMQQRPSVQASRKNDGFA